MTLSKEASLFLDRILGHVPLATGSSEFADGLHGKLAETIQSDDDLLRSTPQLKNLLATNKETHKVSYVLKQCYSILDHALCNRNAGSANTSVALRLTRNMVLWILENAGSTSEAVGHFVDQAGVDSAMPLIGLCQEYIVVVPLNQTTFLCQVNVMLLLLAFFSSDVFHPTELNTLLEKSLLGEELPAFINALAQRIAAWGLDLAPKPVITIQQGSGAANPSLLNLYNLFSATTKTSTLDLGQLAGSSTLQLLLILASHRKGESSTFQNRALHQLSHIGEVVPLAHLLTTIKRKSLTRSPEMLVFFYLLLLDHHTFLSFCLHDSEGLEQLKDVVVAVLRVLYDSTSVGTQYLGLAILHLFSHDMVFCTLIQQWTTTAPWYKERHLGTLSLGSLAIICCLRVVANTSATDKITELAIMAVGLFSNLAPFTSSIHPYAAQRVVGFCQALIKRLIHAQPGDQTIQVPLELFVGLTEGMFEVLSGSDRNNDTLVYELLYHSERLFHNQLDHLKEAARPLATLKTLTDFFEAELASFSSGHTPDDILAVIRRSMPEAVSIARVHQPEEERFLAYQYRETTDAGAFLRLFLWSSIVSEGTPGVSWGGKGAMKLFC